MRSPVREFCAAIIALVVVIAPASAQQYAPNRFSMGAAEVRVNYSIRVPLKGDDEASQNETMEHGRRMLYEMSAKECELILATIASSCRLEGLNIQANVMRRNRHNGDALNLSANARFKIELKERPASASGAQ
jgi:hypothetical protein